MDKAEFIVKTISMDEASELFSNYTPKKEIERTTKEDLITTSEFPKHRAFVKRAFKDAIANILDKYSANNDSGIEYGCGSSAFLFTTLPERFKDNWEMYDINPKVVENANKILEKLGYKNKVKLSNIYKISKTHRNTPLIMGLSSWDSSFNLGQAMFEVYHALSTNGVFIHVQDLYPAKNVALGREWKRRKEHGILNDLIEYKIYKDDQ